MEAIKEVILIESILTSIKKMIGITEDDTHFDSEIIIHINTAFVVLTQLGAGPPEGFTIQDKNSVWSDFLADNKRLEFVKSFVYLKVKLIFDPPLSSAVIESINRTVEELEWRIMVEIDSHNT